ncbi:hypothetical protein V492_02110 [Pseudogymnoascus sp. VKM F-4246]|nr:hypothetical protein V492_02110 [Pseudogymnoascus sp. VKM F-4246]
MRLPQEILDAILLCIGNDASPCFPYKGSISRRSRRDAVQHLASLRLVNKNFCASLSPLLFRHVVAVCVPLQVKSPLVRLVEVSKSPYAVYVQRVDVGVRFFENSGAQPPSLYVDDLAGVLPGCLARLPNINALRFYDTPSSLPRENARIAIDTISTALRYGELSNLTELEITLPAASDFRNFLGVEITKLRTPIKRTLQGLRHLGLHVGGKTNYSRSDRTEAAYIFRLLEHAINITSLAISSEYSLNLTNFQFLGLLRLESLDLRGVETSAEALASIIERSKKLIRNIQLHDVRLDVGWWETIFRRMNRLPGLLDVDIGACGYSFTGANQRLAEQAPVAHPPGWPQAVLSENINDSWAFYNLLLQVNTNRIAAGFPLMPERLYRCMYWGSPYGPSGMHDSPATWSSRALLPPCVITIDPPLLPLPTATSKIQQPQAKGIKDLTTYTIDKEAVGILKSQYTILTMVGPVRSRRGPKRVTTYDYRRALKDIRQPGKRATPKDKKGYKKLLEELRQREDNLTKMKPAKKNGKKDTEKDEEYEVERVLDSRVHNGELKFYILWKGFSMEEATWEPRSNLENSTEAIDEYFEAYPGNPGGPQSYSRLGSSSLKTTEKAAEAEQAL